jgi:hypothetical protein
MFTDFGPVLETAAECKNAAVATIMLHDDPHLFANVCGNGNLSAVKYLTPFVCQICPQVITEAFVKACTNGQLNVAKWMLYRKITPVISPEVFSKCYAEADRNGHPEVAKWIIRLSPDLCN